MKGVSGAINKFMVNEINTEIEESDSKSRRSLKDQDLHNLPVYLVQPTEP